MGSVTDIEIQLRALLAELRNKVRGTNQQFLDYLFSKVVAPNVTLSVTDFLFGGELEADLIIPDDKRFIWRASDLTYPFVMKVGTVNGNYYWATETPTATQFIRIHGQLGLQVRVGHEIWNSDYSTREGNLTTQNGTLQLEAENGRTLLLYGADQVIIKALNELILQSSADEDDYIQLYTSGNVPRMKIIGTAGLYFETNHGGYANFYVCKDGTPTKYGYLGYNKSADRPELASSVELALIANNDIDDYLLLNTASNEIRIKRIGGTDVFIESDDVGYSGVRVIGDSDSEYIIMRYNKPNNYGAIWSSHKIVLFANAVTSDYLQLETVGGEPKVTWFEGVNNPYLNATRVNDLTDGGVSSLHSHDKALTDLTDVSISGASMEDGLMWSSGNASYVPMILISHNGVTGSGVWFFRPTATGQIDVIFVLPIPTVRGNQSLYTTGYDLGLWDADGGDYVDRVVLIGQNATAQTTIDTDNTNWDSVGRKTNTWAGGAHDLSGYETVFLEVRLQITTTTDLELSFVRLNSYYSG